MELRSGENAIYKIFIAILLTTEFFYIEILGGHIRIYHLLAPLIIILNIKALPKLLHSGTTIALFIFTVINIVAAAFADSPQEALKSLTLLLLNIAVAFSVGLAIINDKIRLKSILKIFLLIAIIGTFFGIFQIIIYRSIGIAIGLSESQDRQIVDGFASGFRTEANTFAKYLNIVLFLYLPSLLTYPKRRTVLTIFICIVMGILSSFTRSAIYGLIITLALIAIWYKYTGRLKNATPRLLAIIMTAVICVLILLSIASYYSDYIAHKLTFFFDSNEIIEGGSSSLRLVSMAILWKGFTTSIKTIVIGNGWGQIRFLLGDTEIQAGGAEIITALSYGGIFGGLAYLGYIITPITTLHRCLKKEIINNTSRMHEGVLFALLNILITGQINGSLNAPEYWIIFGIAASLRYSNQNTTSPLDFPLLDRLSRKQA
nr:hypothetical protein [uncultured Holophaga sp.]